MFDKLTTIAAWTVLAFITFATVAPIQDRPDIIEHLAAFVVLGVLFCIAYPRQIAFVCLVVVGSAVLLEYAQLLTPDRHGRVEDGLEKIAGAAAGIVLGRAIIYFSRANRSSK
jgi:VanZ family protein